MSFPRYESYKDSGVEWLGEVPEHWEVTLAKRFLTVKSGDMISSTEETEDGYQIIGGNGFRAYTATTNTAGNTIVIGRVGALCGCVHYIKEDFWASEHAFRVIPKKSFSNQFFFYLLSAINLNGFAIKTAQPLINTEIVENQWISIPPLQEQPLIAQILDRETAKIDALIAEQKRLIELLKEKRQAVISHAVTKGLNPDVPMKSSGIEWLGEVPEHWTVAPIGDRCSVQLGKMLDASKITGEHLRPYLRVADVQWGKININDLPVMDFTEDDRERFKLLVGDILVNEGGSYPGRSAIWSGEIEECYYQKALHRMRIRQADKDSSAFIFYLMYWAANHGVFTAGGNEATIEHLPAEKLRRYRFPFPPIEEQQEIVAFLDYETTKIDTLTTEAQRAIELLKERRTALISAAVTGKIDVRSYNPTLNS